MALVGRVRVELKRCPYIALRREVAEVEIGTDDANHDMGFGAQRQALSDHLRITVKPPLPELLADHGHASAVREVFLRIEGSTLHDLRAEQLEEVGRRLSPAELLWEVAARMVQQAAAKCGDVLEEVGLPSPESELRG